MKRLAALFLFLAAPAAADPWVGPGDARLRTDIELLSAHGYIVGPIDAWPLPWAQINRGLHRAEADGALPPYLAAAVQRVRVVSDLYAQKTHFEVHAAATNEAALVRTFDSVARNRAEASVLASHDFGRVHVSWGGSWQSKGTEGRPATEHGNGFAPDNTYAAIRLGDNWAL